MPQSATSIKQSDLQRWRLIERFQAVLAEEVEKRGGLAGTWADDRRELKLESYLGLFLFGLFNPVVETMRGLCEASELARVQGEVCGRPVSLGSFSEAQAVVDPELLKAVLQRLATEADTPELRRGFTGRERVIDSSVWQVLPRMAWAFWRRQGGLDNAVRLHVALDLASGQISDAKLTRAKKCEREQWREFAQPGICDIADRYYSYDYRQLADLQAAGTDFVVRLRVDAQWREESCELLTAADHAAGVVWASTVRLGRDGQGPRVRVVAILGEEETILMATTLFAADFPPEMIAHFYRRRWEVEMFFRWLKCILGCRHWLAESERGVALQVYLALIAAQLLVLYRGERPNRRQMEAFQFYLMGWATLDELMARLRPRTSAKKPACSQKKLNPSPRLGAPRAPGSAALALVPPPRPARRRLPIGTCGKPSCGIFPPRARSIHHAEHNWQPACGARCAFPESASELAAYENLSSSQLSALNCMLRLRRHFSSPDVFRQRTIDSVCLTKFCSLATESSSCFLETHPTPLSNPRHAFIASPKVFLRQPRCRARPCAVG